MTQKKKIAFCITHTQLGGAQKYVYNLMSALQDRYDIYCISSFEGALREDFYALEGVRRIEIKGLVRRIAPLRDMQALSSLTRVFRTHRFSLVHFNSPKTAFLGRIALARARLPTAVFYTFHLLEFSFPCRNVKEWVCKVIERMLGTMTDCLIVNSAYEKKVLLRHGFSPDIVRLVYPGIDTAPFIAVRERRMRMRTTPQELRLLHITSFKPQKDPFFFLRFCRHAVALDPSLSVDILGDGPLKKRAERFIARHGLSRSIRVHGWRKDVDRFLEQAAYLVVTSRRESLSYAVLEALIAGVPVLSTCRGPLEEIVGQGVNGCFLKKSARPMALHIRNMLQTAESLYTINPAPHLPCPAASGDGRRTDKDSLSRDILAEFWSRERMVGEVEGLYREHLEHP